jgi:hypothetical protein
VSVESIRGRLTGDCVNSITEASEGSVYYELEADRRLYTQYYRQADRHLCGQYYGTLVSA